MIECMPCGRLFPSRLHSLLTNALVACSSRVLSFALLWMANSRLSACMPACLRVCLALPLCLGSSIAWCMPAHYDVNHSLTVVPFSHTFSHTERSTTASCA